MPSSRRSGADPFELHRQVAQLGSSTLGIEPLWVYEGADGVLVIYNGVTRATRIAKLNPGTTVRVDVMGRLGRPQAGALRIGDLI